MRYAKVLAIGMNVLLAVAVAGCGGGSGGSNGGGSSPPPSGVAIAISPSSATVSFGGTKQFTATVTGTTNTAVTWSVSSSGGNGAQIGSISSAGLFTAPSESSLSAMGSPHQVSVTANNDSQNIDVTVPAVNAVDSVTVTAKSQADSSKSASATVTLSGLSILAVGQCTLSGATLTCQGGSTGTSAARGSMINLFVGGYGIVSGTTFSISNNGSTPPDVVVAPSSSYSFGTANDGTPAVSFSVTISPTATPGLRNIVVTNPAGELSAFPGGLMITP